MSHTETSSKRRNFLIAATSAVGATGVAALATPFLASWSPSARALAAGASVEFDVRKVAAGQMLRVVWRGKPVWVVNRTEEMLANLATNDKSLRDPESLVKEQQPDYAQNPHRRVSTIHKHPQRRHGLYWSPSRTTEFCSGISSRNAIL